MLDFIPWNWVARLVAIAAVIGACYWAYDHYIYNPIFDKGVAQERVKTEAAVAERDTAQRELRQLRDKSKAEAARIAKAKAENERESAEVVKSLQSEIDRLAAESVAPPAKTKEEACNETNRLLDEYSARRLRD